MRRRLGFTLAEMAIVVSIVGLLAVIAVPHIRKAWMRSRNSAFISDLRTLSDNVVGLYAIETGDFPPDAPTGVQPDGMEEYMARSMEWAATTPIGGKWDWDRAADRKSKVHGVYAGLSVVSPQRTSVQMVEIDTRIDDGDLSSGIFRACTGGYIYILQE